LKLDIPQLSSFVPDKDFTMRWLQGLLSVSLLAGSAFGAKKSTEERFKQYHTKALSSAPVKLNDASYKDLTGVPRDYSGVVLLTALETRFGCELCRLFQPEWDLLSRSWTKGDKKGDSRVIFGTLDFSDGRETFVAVGSTLLSSAANRILTVVYHSSACKLPPSSSISLQQSALTPPHPQSRFALTSPTEPRLRSRFTNGSSVTRLTALIRPSSAHSTG